MRRAVVYTTATNLGIQALAAVSGVLLARMLGPEGRGEFAAVLLWPMLLANVALVGMDVETARLAAANRRSVRALVGLALRAALIAGGLGAFIGWWLLPAVLPGDKLHLLGTSRAMLLVIAASVANVLVFSIALGREDHRAYNLSRLSFSLVYVTLLSVVALSASAQVSVVAAAFGFAAALGVVVSLVIVLRGHEPAAMAEPDFTLRSLLRGAWPFAGSNALQALNIYIAQVMLIALSDSHTLGLYAVAFVFASAQSSFATAMASLSFARVASAGDELGAQWLIERAQIAIVAAVAIMLIVMVVGPHLLPLLFGEAFSAAVPIMLAIVPASALSGVALMFDHVLRGRGVVRGGIRARALGVLLVIGVSVVTEPSLGVYGVVLGVNVGALCELYVLARAAASHFEANTVELLSLRLSMVRRILSAAMGRANR
ncbi:MAG: oligosaccharide flippase family protein [Chromatiales bacterium]|nr:oligosaccharide flippase family protein [Chromatiales bacterium]